MPSVVLITGASGYLGARVASRLAAEDRFERVLAIDTVAPRPADAARFGRAEFVRVDLRSPLLGMVLAQAGVDTIVHLPDATPTRPQVPIRAGYVAGTTQLLQAAERSETVQRLVVGSSTAIYGANFRDPSVFTESSRSVSALPHGHPRGAAVIERRVRAFRRARGDVATTVLRMATIVGPTADTWLTRYLTLPVVPTPLGFDPRLQVLHEDDAEAVLVAAAGDASHPPRSAALNAAGVGVVPLSQVLRLIGRVGVPVAVPGRAVRALAALGTATGLFSDGADVLRFGRGVDVSALQRRFPPGPRYSTEEALVDFWQARRRGVVPAVRPLAADALAAAERWTRRLAAGLAS